MGKGEGGRGKGEGGGVCNGVLKYSNTFGSNAQLIVNYEFCMTVPRNFVHDCSFASGFKTSPSRF